MRGLVQGDESLQQQQQLCFTSYAATLHITTHLK